MGLWIQDKERLRRELAADQGKRKQLWEALEERAMASTMHRKELLQPGDNMEWWHLVWERVSDAAFVQAVKPRPELAQWLREVVLDLCRRPADDWIGPWFRKRTEPVNGMLETAHIVAAVAHAYDLCPELFSAEELEEIRQAVAVKGMEPCRRSAARYVEGQNHINNWFMVLANGFGTAAAMLGDEAAIQEAVGFYKLAARLYNSDSYGESVQYSNYATLHLVHLREVLLRYDSTLASRLDPGCFARLMPWYAASLMYMKPLAGWGEEAYPRTVNFGDSSAIFRPTGDVLLHVAVRCAGEYPLEAGLARWLFDTSYANPRLGPTDRATFGFINSYQFASLLLYGEAAPAITPEEAKLPLLAQFETGTITARDKWEKPDTILAVQGGFRPHNVSSHRHEDQNSFILAHRQERFFIDPGHCCYRLNAFHTSARTASHNTWSFLAEPDQAGGEAKLIRQKPVTGNIFKPHEISNQNRIVQQAAAYLHVIRCDSAEMYGDPIVKAERTWIAAMPHVLFIVDQVESRTPVKLQSHFLLNNRDNRLKVNVAADNKLVLRRNEAALKFFLMEARSGEQDNPYRLQRDWGFVHDCYHPQPNQEGQGKEGSALIFRYETEHCHTSHTMVYAIAMDGEPLIKGWHLKLLEDGSYFVEAPGGQGGISLQLNKEDWLLQDRWSGEAFRIASGHVEKL